MSDYPPAPPYGASYGSQPQTNPSYHPPYPNQYIQQDDGRAAQTHMASNYDASMSTHGYNNSIPGFSAGSLAPAVPPLPIYQGWNQDAIPLPSYSTPQNNMQYTGYGGNSYQTPHSYSAPQPHTYQPNTQQSPFDEGELSEAEFDGYGGQNAGATASTSYGSNYYHGNDGTGYMNTAHRAVYPSGQDYNNQQYASSNENNNYHRESASYSPYAPAPLDAAQDERSRGKQSYNTYVPDHAADQPVSSTPQAYPSNVPAPQVQSLKPVERLPTPAQQLPAKPSQSGNLEVSKAVVEVCSPAPQSLIQDELSPPSGFKSVAEARKKAEGAILNLWPYDVRFPNYIEEGLDENIVGHLFDSLGFSRAAKTAISIVDENSMIDKVNNTSWQGNILGGLGQGNKAPMSNKHEAGKTLLNERSTFASSSLWDDAKGREVLVEKNGNGVAPSAAAPAQNKPNEPSDKEKNLKMKMEMLRKSREERAQKAAAKTTTTTATASHAEASEHSTLTTAPITKPVVSSPLPLTQKSTPHQPIPPSSTQPVLQPQPPIIPGLFLASASSPAPPTAIQRVMNGASQNPQRKRPVAADFDTPTSTMPFKRPFGQSRNDSLVIDVSEEELDSEDEDVAMDLESQADQDSPVQSARKMSDQRTAAIQNLPPLTNFPTRKAFNSPPGSSAASTPPVHPGSKSALGHPQVLQQKETEIEALKKKIAEAEAAKAAKRRAQQTSSGAVTPQPQAPNGASGVANINGDIVSKVEASIHMQQLIGIAEDKVTSDQKRLAETQAAELQKAIEVKRNEAESRRLRREKIATDLPRVDAEVEQSQLKLQQLREEMAKIEAAVQKSMEDKRRMAEEMERLGQEAEEQLQEQKDRLKDLTTAEFASTTGSPRAASLPTAEANHRQLALPTRYIPSDLDPSSKSPSSSVNLGQEEVSPPIETPISATNGVPHGSSSVEDPGSRAKPVESSHGVTSDQAMEAALQETIRADADSHEDGEGEMDIDIEDSYAPDPAQLAPESPQNVIIDDSAIPATEIQMGDSGHNEGELPNAQHNSTIENEDEYEPPDATPPVDSPVESPPFSPAPPESVPDLEEFTYDTPALGHSVQKNHSIGENDSAKQVNGSVPHLIEGDTERSNQIQFFTPYESPLKHFRAFRFHPDFKQEISGGLRSMTYSHKIDPNIEFCRYELAGGVCNDKSCEFQHFRDIALPEDTILSTLGSPEEFPADQQQKFREGLRQVLTGLRARKVRDFDTIAAEVVAHRSKFLGDPSKVLMLEGTTI